MFPPFPPAPSLNATKKNLERFGGGCIYGMYVCQTIPTDVEYTNAAELGLFPGEMAGAAL